MSDGGWLWAVFTIIAAAAADVENAQTGERIKLLLITREMPARCRLDEAEPHRVELVQHGHGTALIPPLGRKSRKMRNRRRIDGR